MYAARLEASIDFRLHNDVERLQMIPITGADYAAHDFKFGHAVFDIIVRSCIEQPVKAQEWSGRHTQLGIVVKTGAPRASNAAAIADSWGDPEVAAARLTRNGVTVTVDGNTSEHRSVREAFCHYRLPDERHIRFRILLKQFQARDFIHNDKVYAFELV